jgi:hypothetical protein
MQQLGKTPFIEATQQSPWSSEVMSADIQRADLPLCRILLC